MGAFHGYQCIDSHRLGMLGQRCERTQHANAVALAFHQLRHFFKSVVVAHFAPSSTHTKPCAAGFFYFQGFSCYFLCLHSLVHFRIGVVACCLRAVSSILRAAACLHLLQCAYLPFICIFVLAVHRGSAADYSKHGRIADFGNLWARPASPFTHVWGNIDC